MCDLAKANYDTGFVVHNFDPGTINLVTNRTQSFRSMKLSMAPAGLSGYSFSTTSSFSTNVFGCTKIFLGYAKTSASPDEHPANTQRHGTYQLLPEDEVADLAVPAREWRG